MVLSLVLKFLYPPPPSIVVTAMSLFSFVVLTNAGWKEAKGENMQYSKLLNKKEKPAPSVPSKIGMLVLYTPALIAGVSSFFLCPIGSLRFTLLRSAVTAHFLKRVLEVLFVHKFSGSMEVEAMIIISLSYFGSAATSIYNQLLEETIPEPVVDLKYTGVALLALGLIGNFYHHVILSRLRSLKSDFKYKIPKGGLFSLVICPHYLFEILGFVGISCIAQTIYPLSFTVGSTFYLMGRSYATLKWYRAKFDEFPEDVKALVPYIY